MSGIDKLLAKIEKYDVNKILFDVWNTSQVEQFIVNLNTQKQLHDKGIDSLGVSLSPAYTFVTLQFKNAKGQRLDHVTLKDTGQFYESFEIIVNPKGFDVVAVDRHNLKDKYGENIIGLTDENIKILSEFIAPFYSASAKKIVQ